MNRLPDECDNKDCLFHPFAKHQYTLSEQHTVMKKTGLFNLNNPPMNLQQRISMWNNMIERNDIAVQTYAAHAEGKVYTPRTWNHAFVLLAQQISLASV